ncbi:hybrid sensor histidine kinase/response regulator [Clostridia bacterium]|nr:hybrid sensor histidine kinase/response regulator [Clostridia bacterium]
MVILSNTLATMYHAEGTVGLLSLVTDSKLGVEYDSLMTTVFNQIDSLKKVSNEPVMNEHLDSLNLLLLQKKENTAELVNLVKSFQENTIKEITKTTILSRNDMDALDNLLTNTIQQSEDTTKIVGEKKGFFRRLGDAIKTSTPDTLQQISSSSTSTQQEMIVPVIRDTIVEFIREINKAAQKKNAEITVQLMLKQNELYSVNERTTAQINRIMSELEAIEYNDTLKLSNERTETIRRSSIIMSILAFSAIIVALIFMSWILHSLTVSQRLQHQIEAAKKNVEELLASREQLMLTITHDIKAPVSSILGYLELMVKDKPSSRDGYYIENMQHSATHILDLVRNLLDFHALDIHQQTPDQLPFSPYILLSDIYESFIPTAQKKELRFEFQADLDKEENQVSDPYRIRQIVNNVLSNAIKYTPDKGSVVLSAKLIRNKQQTELFIAVRDTGPGIKEQDKKQIFEAFKRLDYTGNGIEGFGLGLNISNKMAQLLGGSISVDSTFGKGSVFTVSLPVHKMSPSVSKPVKKQSNSHPVRILFIDDDTIQLDLVSKITEREGMIPHTCSNSPDALSLLQNEPFDIIFSDIQMPDMNGFELVERIRRSDFKGAADIPIIGLSANSYVSREKYKEAGFTSFLVKPFTSGQLIETIYHYTTGSKKPTIAVSPKKNKGFEALIEFAGDDPTAGKSIIRSFIIETEKNYTLLNQAFLDDDWVTIRNIAHKMQPLMKMISADELVALLESYTSGSQDKRNKILLLKLIRENIQAANLFIT